MLQRPVTITVSTCRTAHGTFCMLFSSKASAHPIVAISQQGHSIAFVETYLQSHSSCKVVSCGPAVQGVSHVTRIIPPRLALLMVLMVTPAMHDFRYCMCYGATTRAYMQLQGILQKEQTTGEGKKRC